MKKGLFILILLIIISCTPNIKGDATRFKFGTFEIPEGSNYSKTIITRIDSLQIETYTKFVEITSDSGVVQKQLKHTDTLFIEWKNNFNYTLRMKSPKTALDKEPIFVQITKVTDSTYSFTAKIGYSKFKQEGTVYKVN